MADLPELVLESRTQSAETIRQIMEDSGYEHVETDEQTDATPPAPPVAPPAGETPSKDSPAPSPKPGGETPAGGEEEGETGQEALPSEGEPAQAKKKGGFARKLERQAVELTSLKATIEDLSRKLAVPSAGQPGEKPPASSAAYPAPKPAEVVEDPEPTIEDFEDKDDPYGEWVKAQARWAVRDERRQESKRDEDKQASEESARRSRVDESARLAAEAETAAITERWNSNVNQARATHPDFDEVILRPRQTGKDVGNPVMVNIANDYDEVAELCYWLITHPDEAARIEAQTRLPDNLVQLGPRARQRAIRVAEDAARESFDRILPQLAAPSPAPAPGTAASRETRAAAAPSPARVVPPRSKAEPPKPVGNRGGSVTRRYPQDYTPEELRAMPIERVRELRGMRSS